VKASNLLELWATPGNNRVTSKQYSFRLPVHVAARIEALCEMYPSKNRTQIVADLLTSALDEVEKSFPSVTGAPFIEDPDTGQELFEEVGPIIRFRSLANRYYVELERELGNETAEPFFLVNLVTTGK
jgi:hypothetical protein